jgi:phosphate transport system substrate-binding protein
MKQVFWSLGILLIIFSASVACADEVRIATGHTFIKRVFDPVRNAFKEKSGIDIHIYFNDPVPALAELEKGNVDVAGASLVFEEWLALAKNEGVPLMAAAAYSSYVPVTELSMIMVNEANKVTTLSKEQLKGIFTGRIRNWKEVGGDDVPILVVWPSVSSGALVVFKARTLGNEAIAKTVYDVETIADTAGAIAAAPEAIGIVTGTQAEQGLKEVAPAIERPLTLVYKGKPSPNVQKLLDFLKSDGKKYIH